MKKAVLLLIVLMFCLPGYGVMRNHGILVYNIVYAYKGASLDSITDSNDPLTGKWSYRTLNAKGFWIVDANYINPGVVHFDTVKQIVLFSASEYDLSNMTDEINIVQVAQEDKAHTIFIDQWIIEPNSSENGVMGLFAGKVKTRDIGIGCDNKKPVAASMKGQIVGDDTKAGTAEGNVLEGKFTLSLNARWTKQANDAVTGFNSDMDTFLGKDPNDNKLSLVEWLESKGYTTATE